MRECWRGPKPACSTLFVPIATADRRCRFPRRRRPSTFCLRTLPAPLLPWRAAVTRQKQRAGRYADRKRLPILRQRQAKGALTGDGYEHLHASARTVPEFTKQAQKAEHAPPGGPRSIEKVHARPKHVLHRQHPARTSRLALARIPPARRDRACDRRPRRSIIISQPLRGARPCLAYRSRWIRT